MKKRIFISACEHSAEMHCANLIKAVSARTSSDDEIEWVGLGGEKMEAAGCELLENTVDKAAMLYNVVGQIGAYFKRINRVKRYFRDNKVDLCIVCDSPAFNFHIAKAAKRTGTKVLFYVAPQLWAWAPWRIFKLRRCCDRLACILPFEKEWFSKRKMDVRFVGNPLFDGAGAMVADEAKDYSDYDKRIAKVALLPGSRGAEIDTLWEPMQRIAIRLAERFAEIEFTVAAVDDEKLKALKAARVDGFDCEYVVDDVPGLVRRSDLAVVASGSATLQVAAAGCPMAVMYQSNKIMWHLLGRWLINIKHLSLPNILAGKELVPEFMPYFDSVEPIVESCAGLLSDKNKLAATSGELVKLVKPMAEHRASAEVAELVIEMIR
ncbi:MAG: lipid-A-disaccharide synthase [Anaerohalosphaera sp.]|nr:lipid-A-disaccharide synthase [Anaerohalosphaera sp.]